MALILWPATSALIRPSRLPRPLAEKNGAYGVAADQALTARLGVKLGDLFVIGDARYQLRALLTAEPDKLAGGIAFGPRVLTSEQGLRATGLLQPGALSPLALSRRSRACRRRAGEPGGHRQFRSRGAKNIPRGRLEVRTRKNISPQFSRSLDQFTQFLTLVGLTSLIIGGVGVANAIRAYVERKRQTIATLKSLGATGSTVFALMLTQVMLVACLGLAIGAMIGAALPFIAVWSFGALIPFPLVPSIHPAAIGQGALYGFLTALAFSLGPLGHAHDVRS